MAAPPTIQSVKVSFVNAQTTLLAQPIAPSRVWRTANDASEADSRLPERLVDDALFALNNLLQKHTRRVYPPQASRHVAEQIHALYAADADRAVGGVEDAEGGIGRELDLTEDDTIDALPQTWPSERDVASYPMEAKRYADTTQRLAELSTRRRELRQRVERLRRMQSVVEPLKTSEGGAGVQENLVTRNGAVEEGLERMRMLLARVAGRVNGLPDVAAEGIVVEDLGKARKRNVDEFLADPSVFPS